MCLCVDIVHALSYVEIFVHPIVHNEVMRHPHSMRLHRMSLSVVVVADFRVIIVRDFLPPYGYHVCNRFVVVSLYSTPLSLFSIYIYIYLVCVCIGFALCCICVLLYEEEEVRFAFVFFPFPVLLLFCLCV